VGTISPYFLYGELFFGTEAGNRTLYTPEIAAIRCCRTSTSTYRSVHVHVHTQHPLAHLSVT
jgi:hypothetical protein